ncbi:hypothetical protein ACIQ9P_03620 [Kitasatospora sp. NPDC094019]|uniref:hypothetical protein n=1 Tax=Kitasatospora sp. NPDC094019 TaxID=3364091 RepID=UPI00382A410C
MSTPEPTVTRATADTLAETATLAAITAAIDGHPGRIDLVIDRNSIAGATYLHGYLDGRLVTRTPIPFNAAEPRLHIHALDSGPVSAARPHSWAEATSNAAADAPPEVAAYLLARIDDYHRPPSGCADCAEHRPLTDAPRWTVVLSSDLEIEQIRQGDPGPHVACEIAATGGLAFVLNAHSIPSAYERAIAVLDAFNDDDRDIPGHPNVLSVLTSPKGRR